MKKLTAAIALALALWLSVAGSALPANQAHAMPARGNITQAVRAAKKKITYVYIATTSGKKYHRSKSCRSLKRSRKIAKMDIKKAKKRYGRCKICY